MPTGKPRHALGLFGGTFDPIHQSHLALACALRDQLALPEVRLIPTGIPAHRAPPHASPEQRYTMAKLAIANLPGLSIDPREVKRHRACYTVETLREIRAEEGATCALWWLIGSDALAQLDTWREWRELFTLTHLAVAYRPGWSPDDLPPVIMQEWRSRQATDFANLLPAGTMRPLDITPSAMSATDVRHSLAHGGDGDGCIPAAVLDYIQQQQLYRSLT